jgi:putative transcriptional regulator
LICQGIKSAQLELAERAGCTRQTIIAVEQGKYVPLLELAFKIASALKTRLEDVFQYGDKRTDEVK